MFTLTPQHPHMCVIDFADNLVERGIAKGYREAGGGSSPDRRSGPGFRKELGKPVFGEPPAVTRTGK